MKDAIEKFRKFGGVSILIVNLNIKLLCYSSVIIKVIQLMVAYAVWCCTDSLITVYSILSIILELIDIDINKIRLVYVLHGIHKFSDIYLNPSSSSKNVCLLVMLPFLLFHCYMKIDALHTCFWRKLSSELMSFRKNNGDHYFLFFLFLTFPQIIEYLFWITLYMSL